jgi:hypothetical protein
MVRYIQQDGNIQNKIYPAFDRNWEYQLWECEGGIWTTLEEQDECFNNFDRKAAGNYGQDLNYAGR